MLYRPLTTQEQIEAVNKAALDDGHPTFCPTMGIHDDNRIVGALSVMPISVVWTHSRLNARKTKEVIDFMEGLMSTSSRIFCVPCVEKSKLFPYMTRYEYIDLGSTHLFVKGLI